MKNDGGGNTGGKAAVKGCGCLVSIFGLPFVLFALLILILMWVMTSLMSCGTDVVLSEILGIEISDEDEKRIKDMFVQEATAYEKIGTYFRDNNAPEQACLAQSFYILFREQVVAKDDYLPSLLYCFRDGVRIRTIERVRERFQVELDDEKMDVIVAYARDNHFDTQGYRPYKNGADLAQLAKKAADSWQYWPGSYGQVMSLDKPYAADYSNPAVWQLLGFRTVDNLGLLRAYAWLDKDTGAIEPSDTNPIVTNYEEVSHVFERATERFGMDEIAVVGEPGMGLYDSKTKEFGIYIGEGEAVYASAVRQKICKEAVTNHAWTDCFCIAGIEYEFIDMGEGEIYITIHSDYLTQANLVLWGPTPYRIPLYFVEGKASVELMVEAGSYHALITSITDVSVDIPWADYGDYQDFEVKGGDYLEFEYLVDMP